MFNMDIYTWMFSLRPKIHEYTSVPASRHKVSNLTTKWIFGPKGEDRIGTRCEYV
jgi:hypothetical protein